MWAKLLDILLVIATLPNSLVDYLGVYTKSQQGPRIAAKIVESNSEVLAVKRSTEQEVTSVVSINCLLD